MRKYLLLSFLFSILFFACNSPKKEIVKPEKLIERTKLTKIIAEAYIIEAVVYFKAQTGIDYGLQTTVYYYNLFKKYGVNRTQFIESLTFYLEYDENVLKIYQDVISILVVDETKEKL